MQTEKMVLRLLGFLKNEEIGYSENKVGQKAYYRVKDPFEGDWLLLPGKGHIFMVYGPAESGAYETLIRELLGK